MLPFEWARLNDIARDILRLFHWFKRRGMKIFLRQGEIARRVGCCRATVNRWLDKLIEREFLKLDRRTPRFCSYVLVTPPVTSCVTSQSVYPLSESIDRRERQFLRRKPPQHERKPSVDWWAVEKLVRGGMEYEAAKLAATS